MSAPTSNEPKTIVVLGGGFAGLHVTHAILQKRKDVKVIVVSKVRYHSLTQSIHSHELYYLTT
jgi:NADH dehydrogenase FAD-containing subunit